MVEKQYKTYENGKVLEVLQNLGYSPIQDGGNCYRTAAKYRNGDSPTSLVIYKDSGWCKDYPTGEKFPLYELVKRTVGTNHPSTILGIINANQVSCPPPKEKLKMQKTYPKDCLERLFPNYSFYNKKNISDATLKAYKMGLATTGKMYQRFVFPVFNEAGEICGFSGRHLNWSEEMAAPKWKHIGDKREWVYPIFLPEYRQNLDNLDEIVLVESIGDSLALYEEGYKNHLVTFGLEVSPAILSFLLAGDYKKIIVSTNNDLEKFDKNGKPTNWGKIAAIKNLIKLSSVFPTEMLEIKLPTTNDFGEMRERGESFSLWAEQKPLDKDDILSTIEENKDKFNDQKLGKFLKKYE